jgi:glycosyltransferase involved in cell wall biosynthesis
VNGETGLLARTMPELGAVVARLVSDPDTAEKLGARAAAFVRERFEAKQVVARIVELYRDLVVARGGRDSGVGKGPDGAAAEASVSHD